MNIRPQSEKRMRNKNKPVDAISRLGAAIGRGLLAGLAGTAAITVSQLIEMQITRRKPSTAPAKAVEKTLHIGPVKGNTEKQFSQEVHWTYGTLWGAVRGLISFAGLKGWVATSVHFAAISSAAMLVVPKITDGEPATEWPAKDIAKELLHHTVYAVAAGMVYDLLIQD